jgi:hypothetical protein
MLLKDLELILCVEEKRQSDSLLPFEQGLASDSSDALAKDEGLICLRGKVLIANFIFLLEELLKVFLAV